MDDFRFGKCMLCGQTKPLQNNICLDCSSAAEQLDSSTFVHDIFNGLFNKEKK